MIVVIIIVVVMTLPLQKSPKWWNLRSQTTLLLLINLQGNNNNNNNNKRQLEPFPFSATQWTNGAQRHHRGRRRCSSREMSHRDVKPTRVPVEQRFHCRRPKWAGQWQLIGHWQRAVWRVEWGRRVEGPKLLLLWLWPAVRTRKLLALFWALRPLRWLMGLIRRPIDPGPSLLWFETSGFRASNEAICCIFTAAKRLEWFHRGGTVPTPMIRCCTLMLLKPSTLTFMLRSAIIQKTLLRWNGCFTRKSVTNLPIIIMITSYCQLKNLHFCWKSYILLSEFQSIVYIFYAESVEVPPWGSKPQVTQLE